jgi:hypothetical protein
VEMLLWDAGRGECCWLSGLLALEDDQFTLELFLVQDLAIDGWMK